MEKSQRFSDVVALGKLLVDELQLEQSVDTLGRWMAHHIAELMQEAANAKGAKRAETEHQCRDAILALWRHLDVFPRGRRPLSDVEPLLATVEALDPDNNAPFYQSQAQSLIDESTLSQESKSWLELANGVDYTARLLIGMCLSKVAGDLAEEKRDFFDLAASLDADTPMIGIVRFLADDEGQTEEQIKADEIRTSIQNLQRRQERLKGMVHMSEKLVSSIDDDIKALERALGS